MARRPGFRYSRWDGTQTGFDLDAESLLDEMSDDLLYHGDLNAALRRMMQQGFRDRNDERLMGLREMLERLRERRRQELESRDLGGVYDDIAEQLNEVVDMEREGIERRVEEATRSGDQRRQELVEDVAEQRRRELEELPPDLAGRVQSLQNYEFMDDAARERFEELMDQLREQLMQSYFNQLSEGMQNMTPERMQRMKDMLNELNQMLEQRERGEEPDFEGFMERFGDFFPGNPQNLDELLEQMAQSMAQMQQLLNSMTPEQRAQLQALSESLLEDMDLRWQVDQLSRNLQNAFPNLPWQRSQNFSGNDPLQFGEMPGLLDTLGDLDALENLMRSATQPGELAEVDLDRARELLGDDAARSLDRLRELTKMLEDAGLIEQREGRLELTPRAIRAIGNKALSDLYRKLMRDRDRPARAGTDRDRQRACARPQAVRVRRPVPPERAGDGEERHLAVGCGHAGAALTRRLRGRAHRDAHPFVDRAPPRRVALDADARQLPARQEGGDGAPHADHEPVPARLLRAGVVRPRRPRGEARAAARDELGLRVGHQHAARAAAGPQATGPPERHQADHHGHRRRAHRPHRGRRGLLPVPAVAGDHRGDAQRGHALHRATASASTPSCSTRATTCARSSSR